tara:strand:- start:867 stop:1349 length:483 start_codon:yes stop_codon:yes gene_type:complete
MEEVRLLAIDPTEFLSPEEGEAAAEWFQTFFSTLDGTSCEWISADVEDLCDRLDDFDALVLWDAHKSAWDDSALHDRLLDLIAICNYRKLPFLGVGFGAKLLGRALGDDIRERCETEGFFNEGVLFGAPYFPSKIAPIVTEFVEGVRETVSTRTVGDIVG